MKKLFLLLVVFAFLYSCAERKVATTQEEMQPKEPEEVTLPAEEKEDIVVVEPVMVEEVSRETVMQQLAEVLGSDIHFDFDRYEIKSTDKSTLKAIADFMIQHSDISVRIEGHCDERGTNEYNLGLGDRRANATKSFLMMQGVPASRILTISYGEERPLCEESNEGCWWKNRRAHFTPAD